MKNFTAILFLTGAILIAVVSAASIPEVNLRSKRYLGSGTNPNNIRVNVGPPQQQPSPVNYGGNGGTRSAYVPQYPSQGSNNGYSQNSNGGGTFQQSVDTNNNGGTHENNVGIGGIQNFAGARGEAQIQKIVADANNNGGSHQTNAGIGGLLLF